MERQRGVDDVGGKFVDEDKRDSGEVKIRKRGWTSVETYYHGILVERAF